MKRAPFGAAAIPSHPADVGPQPEVIRFSPSSTQTGGRGFFIDWRRDDFFEAADQAGCPIDAPPLIPAGSTYSGQLGNSTIICAGTGRE